METLGDKLRASRLKKKASTSEAAASTRIKIQHIEAMENNAFDRIPAPTYAKGFIKLYAEYLGLPHGPLVKEYVDRYMPHTRPSIVPDEDTPQRPGQKPLITNMESHVKDPEPASKVPAISFNVDFKRILDPVKVLLLKIPLKRLASVLGVIAVASLLVVGVSRCVSTMKLAAAEKQEQPKAEKGVERPRAAGGFVREPPEPYLTTSQQP